MKILVTDGRQRSTLAVVRSLGNSSFKVIVGESAQPCLASASRYCSGQLVYPDPLIEPERFKEFVLQELRTGYFGVLAITDIAAQLLASVESELPPGVKLLSASRKPLQCVQDKAVTLLLARNAGIAVPESHQPCDFQELLELSEHLTYPVVIKPRYSHLWSGEHWAHGRVCYAHSKEELLSKYWRAHSLIRGPIVQRYVQGQGRGIFVLLWKDRVMAAFAHRRLREHPPTGGVAVLCASEPMDEILLHQSVRLLRSIGWSGPAMVEYKDDIADGIPKLMEVNGRFWGSLQLATNAGVNFPLTLCRLAAGEDVEPQLNYRRGVKYRWLLGDLRRMWRHYRGDRPLAGSDSGWGILPLMEPYLSYEELCWRDPLPGLFALRTLLEDTRQQTLRFGTVSRHRFQKP